MRGAAEISDHRFGGLGLSSEDADAGAGLAPAAVTIEAAALFACSTWRVIFLIFGASWRNSVGACFTQSAAGPISRLDSHTVITSPPTTTTSEPSQRGIHTLRRRVTSGLASSASSIASITGMSSAEASQQAARETISAISRTGA